MKKICLISSCGGHFMELLQLLPAVGDHYSYIVTEENESNRDIVKKYKNHYFLSQQERKSIQFIFTFISNIIRSLYIIIKERPSHIITTGAGVVFPTCVFGKLLGAKIIYIESFAKINSKSMTGRLVYTFADKFYVQWPEMMSIYPKALYRGAVY